MLKTNLFLINLPTYFVLKKNVYRYVQVCIFKHTIFECLVESLKQNTISRYTNPSTPKYKESYNILLQVDDLDTFFKS